MRAGTALQKAVVAALGEIAELTGVYDGPPARTAFPYAAVDAGFESDWSHKSGAGREVRIAVTIWDDGGRPARLHGLMSAAEEKLSAIPTVLDGWRVVSLHFLRSRIVREPRGPWAGVTEYRARMLAE